MSDSCKDHKTETEKVSNSLAYTRSQREESDSQEYKSALAEHVAKTNHLIDWDGTKVLEHEPNWHMRGIKEALHIRSNPSSMNHGE